MELGFSLEEIKDMLSNSDFDLHKSMEEKIEKMEAEKNRLEQLIGLAKFIKVTGLFPSVPKEMGTIRFEDFLKYSYESLNVDADSQLTILYEMLQYMLSRPNHEWDDEDMQQFFEKVLLKPEGNWSEEDILSIMEVFKEADIESMFILHAYRKELASLSHYEVSHPDVQAVVKKMYDFEKEIVFSEHSDTMTPQWYAQHVPNYFTGSDMGAFNEKMLGKENCEFIIKAIEYFGDHAE